MLVRYRGKKISEPKVKIRRQDEDLQLAYSIRELVWKGRVRWELGDDVCCECGFGYICGICRQI